MQTLFTEPPVIGFAAYSGSGKTTLLSSVLPALAETGLRVGVVKHSHHDFEIDQPGKDSHRLRKAGARQMLIASPFRTAWIEENRPPREPRLEQLLSTLDRGNLDLILVEGFRHTAYPKIEIHRSATGKPFLFSHDASIIAIVSDARTDTSLPQLDIDQPQDVVEFILEYINSMPNGVSA
jgi:molybdopterin-guanine dinucleotide biosynthesis protein MobB